METDELAEQIYSFQFFSEEECRELISKANALNDWKIRPDYEDAAECIPLALLGLEDWFRKRVTERVAPIVADKWKTFKFKAVDEAYIIRYDEKINSMGLHHDEEPVAMIVYLNNDFEGGGTAFPRWNCVLKPKPGKGVVYPGGVSHEHEALPIRSGFRYVLTTALYPIEDVMLERKL